MGNDGGAAATLGQNQELKYCWNGWPMTNRTGKLGNEIRLSDLKPPGIFQLL